MGSVYGGRQSRRSLCRGWVGWWRWWILGEGEWLNGLFNLSREQSVMLSCFGSLPTPLRLGGWLNWSRRNNTHRTPSAPVPVGVTYRGSRERCRAPEGCRPRHTNPFLASKRREESAQFHCNGCIRDGTGGYTRKCSKTSSFSDQSSL